MTSDSDPRSGKARALDDPDSIASSDDTAMIRFDAPDQLIYDRRNWSARSFWISTTILLLMSLVTMAVVTSQTTRLLTSPSTAEPIPELLILAACLVAACVLFQGMLFHIWRQQVRAAKIYDAATDLLRIFAEVESKARTIASNYFDSDLDSTSLAEIVDMFELQRAWTKTEVQEFRTTLLVRNSIVHGGSEPPASTDIIRASATGRRLLKALEEYEHQAPTIASDSVGTRHDYENLVGAALRRGFGDAVAGAAPELGVDFIVELPPGSVLVEVKYERSRRLGLQEVLAVQDRAHSQQSGSGILIVTNSNLSEEIRRLNAIGHNSLPPVEVVSWKDRSDDDLLQRAIARLARRGSTMRGAVFELYRGSDGQYRFRLMAPNGRLLTASQAYPSRTEAMVAIQELRHAAGIARVEDLP